MASLETFEQILKEVVKAKRLSASKMGKLTDIALKCMENDTQLVSILYRTHKSLPTAAKVHSLYAFDALARAARGQVVKHGFIGDASTEQGNAATFLLKVEGVLEGLFQDMISSGTSESKEKSHKILDIWIKSNTFPSPVLARIKEVVKGSDKEPQRVKTITPSDPRTITPPVVASPTTISVPQTPSGVDPVQSTLLALLSQAAAANGQILPNTSVIAPPQPQLDPAQLALLQQLTQTAKVGSISNAPIAVQSRIRPDSMTPPSESVGGPLASHPPPYRDDPRREPRYGRFDKADQGRNYDDYYGDGPSHRGGFRGGPRGRGRGRWDDRDRHRDREHERSPPPRSPRSRSRSPRRYGGRRDVKPYSPPRRPSITTVPKDPYKGASVLPTGPRENGKDEFGRDIRPQSPGTDDIRTQSPPSVTTSVEEASPASANNQMSLSVAANTSQIKSPDASVPSTSASASAMHGLDKFDFATFDFTAPSSWEELGKMWQVTHGYLPSQEELMQFVMAQGMPGSGVVSSQAGMKDGDWSHSDWSGSQANDFAKQTWQGSRGGYGTRARGRGSGFRYGNGRDDQVWASHAASFTDQSDAVVLGGGEEDYSMDESGQSNTGLDADNTAPQQPAAAEHSNTAGGTGRMQRVGDKWVFVREPASGVI